MLEVLQCCWKATAFSWILRHMLQTSRRASLWALRLLRSDLKDTVACLRYWCAAVLLEGLTGRLADLRHANVGEDHENANGSNQSLRSR